MTSEDERKEADRRETSEHSSGETRDATDGSVSDTRAASDASRERSDPRDSESSAQSSGEEQSDDPRDSEDDDLGDIPLDISGHEDRDPPGEQAGFATGSTDSENSDGDESEADDFDTHEGKNSSADAVAGSDADVADGVSTGAGEDTDDGTADDDEEVQPVEVLVGLAKDGEIEPWDIDIVRVTDKFLDRLDEADLRTGGRALFYASVLLRMKGDAMLNEDDDQEPEPEPWEAAAMGEETPIDPEMDPFAALDEEMDRRLERKRARGMPQTLDELVRDLREAERDTWWKESREYDTSQSPHGFQRGTQELDYRSGDDFRMDDEPTEGDVTGTAHEEDIERIIEDVYAKVREQWDAGREEVLYAEVDNAGGSRVETFLGLLFLSHQGRVLLQQDELFGDLWIQDPNASKGSEEAIAD